MRAEEAIAEFRGMATSIARAYSAPGVSREDLEQEALLLVLSSVASWHEAKGLMKNHVRSEVKHGLRRYRRVNRSDRVMTRMIEAVSLDEDVSRDDDGESMTRHDVIGAPASHEAAERGGRTVDSLRRRLSSDAQELVRLRAEGFSLQKIADRTGRTTEAVKKAWQRLTRGRNGNPTEASRSWQRVQKEAA